MSITTHTRQATYDEIVREMDRRGEVIELLEAEIERLRDAILGAYNISLDEAAYAKAKAAAIRAKIEKEGGG